MTVSSTSCVEANPVVTSNDPRGAGDDLLEPLAIIGFSLKYPQDADTPEGFWNVLKEKRDVMTEWPKDRINLDAFFYKDEGQEQQKFVQGAHFLREDLGAFDASFFGISATEAMAMDFQQRKLLELTYHAFESSGIPMEQAYGSRTGVYSGSMSDDYQQILGKDVDDIPKYTASGVARTMLANRISWFYNLHGPSISLDSACSGSLMAFDFACQGLRNRDCEMAVVTGSSVVFAPDGTLSLINMSFLSPRGRCHSFDDRADGYSRGEGFGVILVKRLSDAIRDNNTIRAVVRSTGSNQDGRTPGVTQPSSKMQAALIRETYRKAGLGFNETRFFEAHGTGTPLGDPIEADAIGSVFRTARSPEEPLYVGALKSNVGHLEGGSGVAGLIKAVMVLEKGIIPPNANFDRINPRIDAEFHNLKFPTQCVAWPCSGLRRASIASFGFGGSNSHAILDDAYNYMFSRGIEGNHSTRLHPPNLSLSVTQADTTSKPLLLGLRNGSANATQRGNGFTSVKNGFITNGTHTSGSEEIMLHDATRVQPDRLLVFSASDENGCRRLVETYESYYQNHPDIGKQQAYLDHLAHTLCARRSNLAWKAFAVVNSVDALKSLGDSISKPVSAEPNAKTVFIFTGQGAQYRNMGAELLSHPRFRDTIEAFDRQLIQLGCTWSVAKVLGRQRDSSIEIDDPEYSQTTTTALQIALYDLLQFLGVQATLTVGHSSGEIAAAYAAGYLSLKSACKVSYYRGKCASAFKSRSLKYPGAMMSVDLSEEKMQGYIERFTQHQQSLIYVACVNSPTNVTISGDEAAIHAIEVKLASNKVRTRKLNTGVAYHSPYMNDIALEYAENIAHLEEGVKGGKRPTMISSVSGEYVRDPMVVCTSGYWVANMLSPVQFTKAMSKVSSAMRKKQTQKLGAPKLEVEDVVEIGPHSALRRPVLDCLEHSGVPHANDRYHSALFRQTPAISAVLKLVGELYARGYPVEVQKANEIGFHDVPENPRLLVELPSYPFNHSKTYWHESAISRQSRLRESPQHELLGVPVADWNPLEPRWRKIFDCAEMPWVAHHQVNGTIIYPAAGMISMAIQGSSQIADPDRRIAAYQIRDAVFTAPITIGKTDKSEVQLHMRLDHAHTGRNSMSLGFRVYSASATGWFQNSSGTIQIIYERDQPESHSAVHERENLFFQQKYADALKSCTLKVPEDKLYDQLRSNGLQYGPAFQPLNNLAWDGESGAVGRIRCFGWTSEFLQHDLQPHVVHPTVLDAAGQLPWLALTKGAEDVVVNGAAVTRIQQAWIASSGLSYPETPYLQAYSTTSPKGLRGTDSSIVAFDPAGNLVMRISHMETTAVGGDESSAMVDDSRRICFEMAYKPDVSLLNADQLLTLINVDAHPSNEKPPIGFYEDLGLALFHFTNQALRKSESVGTHEHCQEPHIVRYVSWLKRQLHRYHSGELPHSRPDWLERIEDASAMEKLITRLEQTNAEGELFVHVGRSLDSIIQGLTDPLEVLFKTGLAEKHYQAVCDQIVCCKQLIPYLEALSHKNPQLKVLEVGAGTGSVTGHVLQGLGTSFGRYDYTDISGSFFKEAREKFSEYKRKMNFRLLDIEGDPAEQGYEPESYDVIIAAWVLHATRDLANTISNVHKLLKPGGKLILLEITEPGLLRNGFAFGTLPGWWLSTEPSREWSPCISESQWKQSLEDNGFQGVDIVLPDYASDICHENSILIASVAEQESSNGWNRDTDITLVVDGRSPLQEATALKLQSLIETQGSGTCCTILSIEDQELALLSHPSLVFLVELGQPWLSKLDEASFEFLQELLCRARMVTWVTSTSPEAAALTPELHMVRGLSRVLFVEKPGLAFVTLSFEDAIFDIDVGTQRIGQVILKTVAGASSFPELEYVVRDGVILINRVSESEAMNHMVYSKTQTMVRAQSLEQSPPLALNIPKSGLLDSLRWQEDSRYHEDLDADEIEIEVQAIGVNFRDLLVVLGKVSASHSAVGCECAGVVTRTGANCITLQPGDRVCACIIGCSNTHARFHYQLAVKIPDSLSIAEAASLPCTGVTAYRSLVTLANLQKEDSILIHCATGGTGQMALQIAQSIGAEVYVTVGTEEKRRLVRDVYGVSDAHIFHSRDTSFAQDIYRATNGRGVDVVLNSLSGEALVASWECIAPFGRFVELGKMDIENNSKLPMAQFSKNVTFHAVAVDHLASQRPLATAKALRAVLDMIDKGIMRVASPLNVQRISELESAFRMMQSGKNIGKTVLTYSPSDVVPTWLKPQHSCLLDPDATYLIAGGFGGLGRSAARWMSERGATNLILLSRSGPKSDPAKTLLKDLQEAGVNVRTPRCDVSDSKSLAESLALCADMPAIKGCMQATMVLQDALFETMTWDQWAISIRSKVRSTWNLHTQLPQGLSFFVMLSSVAGIAGSMGQSNYAAGNTFQDALAAHRLALGQKAVSIDLGWMGDIGAVAENAALTKGKESAGDLAPVYANEFLALLDHYCDPGLQLFHKPAQAQPIIGLVTPAQFRSKGIQPPDWLVDRPLFRALTQHTDELDGGTADSSDRDSDRDWVGELLQTSSSTAATNVIVEALVQRLSAATSTPVGEINRARPLHVYGVDSLLAVELRNWFSKTFKADVAIFDITGSASLEQVAEVAASSSILLKGANGINKV